MNIHSIFLETMTAKGTDSVCGMTLSVCVFILQGEVEG